MFLNLLQMPDLATSSNEPTWTLIGVLVGVLLSGIFQLLTVNRKIKADRKRHREDRWWNFKFDLFKEIDAITSDDIMIFRSGAEEKRESEYTDKMLMLGIKCAKIFNDKSIGQDILDIEIELTGNNDPTKLGELFSKVIGSCLKELELK